MTIEQKIADLMAESEKFEAAAIEQTPEELALAEAEAKAAEEKALAEAEALEKAEAAKLVKEEIKVDVAADVAALIEGEELSEEFKIKATTIFEAAVVNRVKAEVAKIDEAYTAKFDAELSEAVDAEVTGLIEKVDGYLSYMAEEWMIENELALESGIKTEITENFMSRLKDVFTESFIDIPEDKVDVVAEMESAVLELEDKLQESEARNIAMHKQLAEQAKHAAIAMQVEGLTDVEADKFKSLAEELSYESAETFGSKLKVIRESYFAKKPVEVKAEMISESVGVVEQPVVNTAVAAYTNFLSR